MMGAQNLWKRVRLKKCTDHPARWHWKFVPFWVVTLKAYLGFAHFLAMSQYSRFTLFDISLWLFSLVPRHSFWAIPKCLAIPTSWRLSFCSFNKKPVKTAGSQPKESQKLRIKAPQGRVKRFGGTGGLVRSANRPPNRAIGLQKASKSLSKSRDSSVFFQVSFPFYHF